MTVFERVEVRVLVDNVPLPEYDVPHGEVNTADYYDSPSVPQIHKYLESVPGANFEIDFKPDSNFQFKKADHLTAYISLDGQFVDGPMFSRDRRNEPMYRRVSEGSAPTIWPARRSIDRDALVSIGTIKIALQRHISIGKAHHKDYTLDLGKTHLSEKSLKGCGKDIRSTLDPSEPGSKQTFHEAKPFDRRPLAIVVFHCFSRGQRNDKAPFPNLLTKIDGLQKIGVIERPRSPTPLENRPRDTLTRTEMLTLLERNQAGQATQEELARQLKQELAKAQQELAMTRKRNRTTVEDDNDDDDLQVAKRAKAEPTRDVEVVELSD